MDSQFGNAFANGLNIPSTSLQTLDMLGNDGLVNRIANGSDPVPEFLKAFDMLHGQL